MTDQIIRGGSWRDFQVNACAYYRYYYPRVNLVDYLGFRVIKKSQQGNPVMRGGSWNYHRDYARCAVRYWSRPGARLDLLGFRILKTKSTK